MGLIFLYQHSGFSGIGGDVGVAEYRNLHAATSGNGDVYKHRHVAYAETREEVD